MDNRFRLRDNSRANGPASKVGRLPSEVCTARALSRQLKHVEAGKG
jgi:hypothetical protein